MTTSPPADEKGSTPPPVVILGVSRSGTGLLRAMLNEHSAIAIPGESNFLPALWNRDRGRWRRDELFRDLEAIARIREWGVDLDEIRRELAADGRLPEVVRALYRSYARARGKARYGDRTPGHMRHLNRLDETFPGAQYVHIVRDGRDAALSYAQMAHRPRVTLTAPVNLDDFSWSWRREVEGAQRHGASVGPSRYYEVRYEDLVGEPAAVLRDVCAYLGVPFEAQMLEYHRRFRARPGSNHRRLADPPTPRVRDWRQAMTAARAERFEAAAGALLDRLGYERRYLRPSLVARGRALLARAINGVRLAAARLVMPAFHRSRWWRWRERRAGQRRAADRLRSERVR